MSKFIYKILNLYFVLYFVRENTLQIAFKDYEQKVQFYGCGFFNMNKKIQVKKKNVTGSQASSMEQRVHQFLKLCMCSKSVELIDCLQLWMYTMVPPGAKAVVYHGVYHGETGQDPPLLQFS